MDATLFLIDSDAELAHARVLVGRLWKSDLAADIARHQAEARLIAAYEESKWPRRPPRTADLIRHLMDQHGLMRRIQSPLASLLGISSSRRTQSSPSSRRRTRRSSSVRPPPASIKTRGETCADGP